MGEVETETAELWTSPKGEFIIAVSVEAEPINNIPMATLRTLIHWRLYTYIVGIYKQTNKQDVHCSVVSNKS